MVPLTQATLRFYVLRVRTIKKNRIGNCFDALHDKVHKGLWEVQFSQHCSEQIPMNPVISFAHICLNSHLMLLCPLNFLTYSKTSWAKSMLFAICLLGTKELCSSLTRFGMTFLTLFAMHLEIFLQITLHRLIGRKCSILSGSSFLGILAMFD